MKTFAFRIPPGARKVFDALVGASSQTPYTDTTGWWRPEDLQLVAGFGYNHGLLSLIRAAPGLVEARLEDAPAWRIYPAYSHMKEQPERQHHGAV